MRSIQRCTTRRPPCRVWTKRPFSSSPPDATVSELELGSALGSLLGLRDFATRVWRGLAGVLAVSVGAGVASVGWAVGAGIAAAVAGSGAGAAGVATGTGWTLE